MLYNLLMKKILTTGLLLGFLLLVVSMLSSQVFYFLFPGLKAEYENPNIFRPWTDPAMQLFFLHPFVLGIILTWLWHKVKGSFGNGLKFALVYWFVTIPGMFISYSSFQISPVMVLSWTVSGLLQSVVAGLYLGRVDR